MNQQSLAPRRGSFLALTPLLVFVGLFFGSSVALGDFYKVPLAPLFIVASVYAVAIARGLPLAERIRLFSRGAGDSGMMLMIWIFVLAGSFAASAKAMGAIDATVQLTQALLPGQWLLPGLFLQPVLCRSPSVRRWARLWRWFPWRLALPRKPVCGCPS